MTRAHRRPSSRTGCSARRSAGRTRPACPPKARSDVWRPLAVRAFEEAVHGAVGPGPGAPQSRVPGAAHGCARRASPPVRGPKVVAAHPATTGTAPLDLEPLRGRGLIIAGGPWAQRADPAGSWRSPTARLAGAWRTPCRAAGSTGRSPPPTPSSAPNRRCPSASSCSVRPGCLGRSGPTSRRGRRRGADHRRRSVAAVGRPLAGGDRVPPVPGRRLARGRRRHGDTVRSAVARRRGETREEAAQAAIADVLGADLSEPLVARSVHRYAAETGATLLVAASMPIRDLEWYAETHPTPPRVLANRGANGIDGVVSTALGIGRLGRGSGHADGRAARRPDLPPRRLGRWSTCPRSRARSSCSTTAGEGSSRSCRRRPSVEPAMFEQLFGTPPTSDIGAVARGFGLPVHEVSALSQLESALAAPPARARPGAGPGPGAERRAARRDQPGGPSRAALRPGAQTRAVVPR